MEIWHPSIAVRTFDVKPQEVGRFDVRSLWHISFDVGAQAYGIPSPHNTGV